MIGERVGNCRIIRRLGAGAMGEVFVAEHETLHTLCAAKVLFPQFADQKSQVARFFDEARAVSRIRHAGIVTIHDAGHVHGRPYLLMDLLEGETLGTRLERGALPHATVCDIAQQIASVLDATHSVGTIHRDLKPDNIFLVPDHQIGERVKVLDFGIAKLTGGMSPGAATLSHSMMGTPMYMAPEQAKDSAKVDGRADIYSLGCIVFEMASGRRPFEASSVMEALRLHAYEIPRRASSIVTDLSTALDELIARMLAKLPADRPQTMGELVDAFAALTWGSRSDAGSAGPAQPAVVVSAPGATLPAASAATAPPRRKRWPWAFAASAGGLAAIMVAIRGCSVDRLPDRPDAGPDAGADIDAPDVTPDAASSSDLQRRMETANPFVAVAEEAFSTTQQQISREQYDWFRSSLDANLATARAPLGAWDPAGPPAQPASWVAFEQARAFCQGLDADLPTYDEWRAIARDQRLRIGPLREWTRTRFEGDDRMVKVVKPDLREPAVLKTTDPSASATERAADILGFRCVRALR